MTDLQCKDIDPLLVLQFAADFKEGRDSRLPGTRLAEIYPGKVVLAKMLKMVSLGLLDYGVSVRSAWPTEKGYQRLAEMTAENKAGTTAMKVNVMEKPTIFCQETPEYSLVHPLVHQFVTVEWAEIASGYREFFVLDIVEGMICLNPAPQARMRLKHPHDNGRPFWVPLAHLLSIQSFVVEETRTDAETAGSH